MPRGSRGCGRVQNKGVERSRRWGNRPSEIRSIRMTGCLSAELPPAFVGGVTGPTSTREVCVTLPGHPWPLQECCGNQSRGGGTPRPSLVTRLSARAFQQLSLARSLRLQDAWTGISTVTRVRRKQVRTHQTPGSLFEGVTEVRCGGKRRAGVGGDGAEGTIRSIQGLAWEM